MAHRALKAHTFHVYGQQDGLELNTVFTFYDADGLVLTGGSDGLALERSTRSNGQSELRRESIRCAGNRGKHGATDAEFFLPSNQSLSRVSSGGELQQPSNCQVNDHEVRISTMTEAYHWHRHPDSDEMFLALEGGLFIDFDDQTVALLPGHMITVNRGVRHRTRPIGERSVNLTFERAGTRSETLT
jgi:mannose-6-phosphate isomerase-like protein (cupin superfamily)